jgi:hypothetical protein
MSLGSSEVCTAVPAQRHVRDGDVDDEQDRRGDDRELGEESRLRIVLVPARDRGDQEQQRRAADERQRHERRLPVELAAAAEEEREPEDEQQVADHAAGQRAAHDLELRRRHREQRDDQLRRVPEGRVEEAADAGAGVVRGMLRRLADQPRERDQRRGGEDEVRGLADAERVVDEDRERRERQRRPEQSACHGRVP